jgi:hypothetical protein
VPSTIRDFPRPGKSRARSARTSDARRCIPCRFDSSCGRAAWRSVRPPCRSPATARRCRSPARRGWRPPAARCRVDPLASELDFGRGAPATRLAHARRRELRLVHRRVGQPCRRLVAGAHVGLLGATACPQLVAWRSPPASSCSGCCRAVLRSDGRRLHALPGQPAPAGGLHAPGRRSWPWRDASRGGIGRRHRGRRLTACPIERGVTTIGGPRRQIWERLPRPCGMELRPQHDRGFVSSGTLEHRPRVGQAVALVAIAWQSGGSVRAQRTRSSLASRHT